MTTNYSALRKSGHLAGTIKRAAALSQQRRDARESSPTQPRLVAISLGPEHVRQTTDVAQVRYPRRENWAHPEPSTDIRLREIIVRTRDHGAYSRNAWYHRLSYVPTIRSCGVVTAGRAVLFVGDRTYRLRAPRGWRYGRDANGLYLVRTTETRTAYRYHPDSDQWIAGLAAIRSAAIAHEQTQQQVSRDARQRAASDKADARLLKTVTIYVCLRDSCAAGNCPAGSATWARQHGLDVRSHVPAAVIRRLAGGSQMVLRALAAAKQRTLTEIRRGYSILTEHQHTR